MHYSERLKRWAVVRLLPNMQRVTLSRFFKESDANGYATILRRLQPNVTYLVVFDPIAPESNDRGGDDRLEC